MISRNAIAFFIERALSREEAVTKQVGAAAVAFLASFYFWGTLILDFFSKINLQSTGKYVPIALEPALILFVGVVLGFALAIFGRRFRETDFLKSVVVIGMLVDFASYEFLSGHLLILQVLLYAHVAVLLVSLGCLRLGLVRVVFALGILCIILPWFLVPIIPVFNFVSSH